MLCVLSAYNFYHFIYGMGGNYTDLQTSWIVGAALFSLVNSEGGRRGRWLVLFGLFTAMAQQSRFVSLGVVAVVCGPILLHYIINRWRSERSVKSLWEPLILIGIPVAIISGYSLFTLTMKMVNFYFVSKVASSGLSNMFKSIEESIDLFLGVFIYRANSFHLGQIGFYLLIIVSTFYVVGFWPVRVNTMDFLHAFWAAASFALLHVFVLLSFTKVG
jgi:hypothetical protein